MRVSVGFLLAGLLWVWADARDDGEGISLSGIALIALGLLLAALGGAAVQATRVSGGRAAPSALGSRSASRPSARSSG